jgi:Putative prokaryotic signal transducing protein
MPDNAIAKPQPDPNEKLVKVFDTEQEPEALVVQGLLESAGIASNVLATELVQDAFPGLGGVVLLVSEDNADAASRIIESYRNSPPVDDETAEISG